MLTSAAQASAKAPDDKTILIGTITAALFVHVLFLMILVLYLQQHNETEGLFHEPGARLDVRTVQFLGQLEKPPPPPPAAPTRTRLPRAAVVGAPRGPSATRNALSGAAAPQVVAARASNAAFAVRVGPGGTGTAPVAGGSGAGPGGPGGGNSNGGGAPPPPPPPPPAPPPAPFQENIRVLSSYETFNECNLPTPSDDRMSGARAIHTWQQLCQMLGVSWQEVGSRPYVKPFQLSPGLPTLGETDALRGRSGAVGVHVTIDRTGRVQVEITQESGSRRCDRVGYNVALTTLWLPALRYGSPVDDAVDYLIRFVTYNGQDGTRPGSGAAPPGGAGPPENGPSAPSATPGGELPGY